MAYADLVTDDAAYLTVTRFAWIPRRMNDGRWVFLRSYYVLVKVWGWFFTDEWRYAEQSVCEAALEKTRKAYNV